VVDETRDFFADVRRKESEARAALRAELALHAKPWPEVRALCEANVGAPCECATRADVFQRIERARRRRGSP
jgi:hypothetical protein